MNNCNIVKDLIPLYKENLLSQESEIFVKDHLKTCKKCQKLLEIDLKIESKKTKPLDFVEKRIKKETKYKILAAVALIGSILIFIFSYLNMPRHFEYEKNLYNVYNNDDTYTVEFSKKVSGIDYTDTEDAIYLDAYTTKYNKIFNKNMPKKAIVFHKNNLKTILYQNHESMPKMVIGSGQVRQTLLPRLFIGFYAFVCIIGFIILSIIIFLIEKFRKKILSLPIKTFFLGGPPALLLGIIAIKGFNTSSYYPINDLKYIGLLSLGLYLFFIFLSIFFEQKRM